MNAMELIEFSRLNTRAIEFLAAATDDYIASRCCLLNGMFPGLRLGAEAVEKFLKGFVLFDNPSLDVENMYNHRIWAIAEDASKVEPSFAPAKLNYVLKRLETHYQNRYPYDDNAAIIRKRPKKPRPKPTRSMSTGEHAGLDDLVLYICECLPIPETPKLRLYGPLFLLCCPWLPARDHQAKWLQQENLAFERAKPMLLQRYKAMEKQLGEG